MEVSVKFVNGNTPRILVELPLSQAKKISEGHYNLTETLRGDIDNAVNWAEIRTTDKGK